MANLIENASLMAQSLWVGQFLLTGIVGTFGAIFATTSFEREDKLHNIRVMIVNYILFFLLLIATANNSLFVFALSVIVIIVDTIFYLVDYNNNKFWVIHPLLNFVVLFFIVALILALPTPLPH